MTATVWILEDCPPHDTSTFLGAYATEALAEEAASRQTYRDYVTYWEEEVVTELPPADPPKRGYQVIP